MSEKPLTAKQVQENKEKFISILREKVKRQGINNLIEFLEKKCDFFYAPASTRFHGAYEGGLCEHSLNVYECLKDYMERQRVREVYGLNISDESIAICALLHDLCKTDVYKVSTKNQKNKTTGKWEEVPFYTFQDDLPYGHGEKSVYMISGFMRLKREEAFAIRFHMGFSNTDDKLTVGRAFELYPFAFAVSVADMEATYFIEGSN